MRSDLVQYMTGSCPARCVAVHFDMKTNLELVIASAVQAHDLNCCLLPFCCCRRRRINITRNRRVLAAAGAC